MMQSPLGSSVPAAPSHPDGRRYFVGDALAIAACSWRPAPLGEIAVCAFPLPLVAGQAVRLLPAGEFRGRDGRPGNVPWRMTAALARQLIARLPQATDLVIDYEHQTLESKNNGQPNPAAGWISPASLEWREPAGDEPGGLYATAPRFTERAANYIKASEYRYVSPVFAYDAASGDVLALLHLALVNDPNLDGLTELAVNRFSGLPTQRPDQETSMTLLEQLLAALGLPANTGEADAVAACKALKTRADQADVQIAALKTQTPDPAKYVPIDVMNNLTQQVANLSKQVAGREVDELVKSAIAACKLVGAQEQWARDYGAKDLDGLKQWIANAPVLVAPNSTQTGGKGPDRGADTSDIQLAICKQLGVTAEQFNAARLDPNGGA